MESSRASDNDDLRDVAWLHALYELVKGLAKTSLAVCHGDERVCLVLDDGFCSRCRWVNDTDDSETSLQTML